MQDVGVRRIQNSDELAILLTMKSKTVKAYDMTMSRILSLKVHNCPVRVKKHILQPDSRKYDDNRWHNEDRVFAVRK